MHVIFSLCDAVAYLLAAPCICASPLHRIYLPTSPSLDLPFLRPSIQFLTFPMQSSLRQAVLLLGRLCLGCAIASLSVSALFRCVMLSCNTIPYHAFALQTRSLLRLRGEYPVPSTPSLTVSCRFVVWLSLSRSEPTLTCHCPVTLCSSSAVSRYTSSRCASPQRRVGLPVSSGLRFAFQIPCRAWL